MNPRGPASRGQTAVEYAVLFTAVCAALLSMSVYMKRGVSGHLRRTSDSIGEQYGPGSTTSSLRTTLTSTSTTSSERSNVDLDGDGIWDAGVMETVTTIDAPETTSRTGSEHVDPQ